MLARHKTFIVLGYMKRRTVGNVESYIRTEAVGGEFYSTGGLVVDPENFPTSIEGLENELVPWPVGFVITNQQRNNSTNQHAFPEAEESVDESLWEGSFILPR